MQLQGVKYRLVCADIDEEVALHIAATHNVMLPTARVLYARGFREPEHIRRFLFSSYEQDVPSGLLLKDALLAVERLERAIERKEKILIFGDYDVDGISSSSLVMACLLPLGAHINFFLPNRARDGYGLSVKVVERAVANNYSLILTVDNGITAHEAAQAAAQYKIDLIITDHHRQHGELPPALAIVNPNRLDCSYPEKGLPGVGVIFKIISLLYERRGLPLPAKAYELLLLGTIADVVPLIGENRYWVRHGLHQINRAYSNSMAVLLKNSGVLKSRLDSLDIGFMVAPQINALGRMSDPRDGVKFLISAQLDDVERVGKVLKELNEARKEVERAIYEHIEQSIAAQHINLITDSVIIAAHNEWPTGVIGLVAGRVMHNYGRPTILLHEGSDGILRGSCRSIKAFNMFDALAQNSDLLIKFGGHSFAAGLSLERANLSKLKERLQEKIARELTADDLVQRIEVDALLDLPDVQQQLLNDFGKLEPFGHQNPQPLFLIRSLYLLNAPQLLKEKHVKCTVFAQGVIKSLIFFNRPDLYAALVNVRDAPFHVAAHVVANEWNGRVSAELHGVDIVLENT